jgi:RNA polymerase-interacting CarD/CdnL/TRCF family regulator
MSVQKHDLFHVEIPVTKKMQQEVPTPKAALTNLAALVSLQRIQGCLHGIQMACVFYTMWVRVLVR